MGWQHRALAALLGTMLLPAFSSLAAPLGQEQLTVDTARSYIVATTCRAGMLGFLGHEHGVLATGWQATVRYDPEAPERSSIEIVDSALELVIDTETARRRARLKQEGPNETEIPEIQTRMLGPEVLDTEQHPLLEFRSERVEARGDNRLRVHGQLTLLGISRPVKVDVWVRKIQQFRLFSGQLEIKQRDFGIDPISMGGVVKVADKVKIRIEMWTLPQE